MQLTCHISVSIWSGLLRTIPEAYILYKCHIRTTMKKSKRLVRPRLLSDIAENVHSDQFEPTEKEYSGEVQNSPSVTPSFHQLQSASTINWSQNTPTLDAPSNPQLAHNSFTQRYQLETLAPTYRAAMSGSAPASTSRAELPTLQTSPPSPSSRSHNVSPAPEMRPSSATDQRPTSPPDSRRGRARYRSASHPRAPVQTGTMDRKSHL
jgi:hypothetical protein